MKKTMLKRFHFIYEVDNIPNYRSRSFGCCPCQMAVRKFGLSQNKKPYQGGNPNTARRKINLSNNQSILPFHHIMASCVKQASKGLFSKTFFYKYKEN